MTQSITHTFHVNGMHCASCTVLLEETFRELPDITAVKVSLAESRMTITGDFTGSSESVAEELTRLVKEHGYSVTVEKREKKTNWGDFAYAFPIAAVVIAGFFALQQSGLTRFIGGSDVGVGTAFVIGLIASVSTCLAVIGGLVLSLSANAAKSGGTWRAQALFHVSRIGGFFLLGGALGAVGSSLRLGFEGTLIIGAGVALVMLILGLNLLDLSHFTKKLQPVLPARFLRRVVRGGNKEHYLAPALIGAGTFFLPCGFTQSMQLYALTTGSFMKGALVMLSFSLGTLPVLSLISFGSFTVAHGPWKGIFFRTAGLVVIAFALLTLANTLAAAGFIDPLLNA